VWGGGPRGEPSQIWHSKFKTGGSNYISYSNKEVDSLIEAARVEFDQEKRDALYRKFQAILHEEQPYTFLWIPARRALINQRIHGVVANLVFWQFADWWVKDDGEAAR